MATGVSVTVDTARVENMRDVINASGMVVPASVADWTVFAPESGQVAELPKREGDVVAQDDVIVRFSIASIAQLVTARELALSDATRRLDRAQDEALKISSLFEKGLTARITYDAARAEVTSAESALMQATADLAATRPHQERATVRARFPGKIVKIWHPEGDFVTGGPTDPVLRVVDPTRVQVAVQLPVAQLARLQPGQTATITAIGGVTEIGTVAQRSSGSDGTAATAEARLSFVNPTTLTVDMVVSTEILIDQRANAIVVPAAAVRRDELGAYVMIAGDDQRARRRDVRAGLVTRDLIQITSGIVEGERVIVSGFDQLSDGVAIMVVR